MLDRLLAKIPGVRSIDALGLDHGGDRYRYERDERFGVLNAEQRPDRWVRTTCGYCSVGCGMYVGVRDDRIVATKGDPDHPVNSGRLCPKGLAEHLPIHAAGRLRVPTVDGRTVGWDDALAEIADRLTSIIDEHGGEAVMPFSDAGNQSLLAKEGISDRFFHHIGATRLMRNICGPTVGAGVAMTNGTPLGADALDLEHSKLIVLWATNTRIGLHGAVALLGQAQERHQSEKNECAEHRHRCLSSDHGFSFGSSATPRQSAEMTGRWSS